MIELDPSGLKDLWTSIFVRKGSNGIYTRLFDDLAASQQKSLLQTANIHADELPVVGSADHDENWFLLTTKRIIWSKNQARTEMPIDEIRDVKANLLKLQRDQLAKDKMDSLEIVSVSGNILEVKLECGGPLSGVWHVLNNIRQRNS